jgi:rod shape-determining protein MreC
MTALLATRAARRKGITFLILAVVALFLMAISSNPVIVEFQKGITFALSPIQRSLDATAGGVAGVVRAITEIDRLRIDNAALRDENDRLRAENIRLGETRRENDLLTGLLQLRAGFEYETVAAAVIAREPAEFRRAVTLDRGSDDGIAQGDVVIAAGGALAGRVVEVGPNFAQVALLTDGSSIVIGQLVSSAATGEVIGQLGGALVMSKIDSGVQVQPGDEVVTAGIELGGGIRSPYPKGLLIGQVIDVRRDANDVVQTAYLQPAAALDRLEYLLVITDYEGGLPPPEQQPIDCGDPEEDGEGTLPGGEQPCFSPPPTALPTDAAASP